MKRRGRWDMISRHIIRKIAFGLPMSLGVSGCELVLGDIPPRADRPDASAACAQPSVFFPDEDGDGYGNPDRAEHLCAPPADAGWTKTAGDCDDGRAYVHPGQTKYFGDGYYAATAPSHLSFDYDCDGVETASPSSLRAPACEIPYLCGTSGFEPRNPPRTGNGVDSYCGSDSLISCSMQAILCVSSKTASSTHYACR